AIKFSPTTNDDFTSTRKVVGLKLSSSITCSPLMETCMSSSTYPSSQPYIGAASRINSRRKYAGVAPLTPLPSTQMPSETRSLTIAALQPALSESSKLRLRQLG